MDITFKFPDKVFNYRVAGLNKKDNNILVCKRKNSDYLTLIGGRVNFNETSLHALKREIKEETNQDINIIKLRGFIENFYISRYDNLPCHELLIIYEFSFLNETTKIISNLEEEESYFTWVPIEELENSNFEPKKILKYLETEEIFHLINKN